MSSVVIILPTIGADLAIPPSAQQIVVSIYNISVGCVMLPWGRIADVYGHHPVFLTGSTLFTLSTLCLPFATGEIAFYVLRALQGVSGAAMIPSGLGTIATTFAPGAARNRGFVAVAAVASLGSILGNLAGGLVGGYLSWKWVFWISTIVGAFTTALDVDWLGAAIISTSLLLLLLALSQGNVIGWSTAWIPPLIVLAVILLIVFFFWQRRSERGSSRPPLLRVSMFKNVRFSALFIMVGCFSRQAKSPNSSYQSYLGLSELQTTLRFLAAGISGGKIILQSPHPSTPASNLTPPSPVPLRPPPIPPTTTYWAHGFPAMLLCFTVEVIWPVASLVIARELPHDDQALGSALLMTSNFVGRALELAVATAAQTGVQRGGVGKVGDGGLLGGLRGGQWVNVGLAVAALGIALGFFRGLGRQ
ncbi:MFS general substrate transporter [Eremomyces bilateralis CBS 781.70]|uniref:MFS general substrate transporter n=1 Tax=Eremomyces bilateralis CBS 781.70 TaxID=1392243 RepID=A0A6G1GBP0_9PEZI|nr:MFS general substrate transporter [Eremomyces bilateralis CBS 781.70]KAF1815507.1 MFS general substrate transporter [Eremomyces bilateralis CBS 781.70]